MKLYAKYAHTDAGNSCDKRICAMYLSCGGLYKVRDVDMGKYCTDIYLENCKPIFNSVMFDFYELTDDNEFKPFDIYSSAEFNPFVKTGAYLEFDKKKLNQSIDGYLEGKYKGGYLY